ELGTVANGAYESWGDYHAARMLLKKGEDDQAKQRLSGLLERLRAQQSPRSAFLMSQAEARLAILDPSLAAQGSSAGGQLTPERIQQLIREAQAQQGQSGETP
ncbi:MAG: hypothetical protein H5U40_08745, partial [Polyangiaceae bacterium]|nr:hypothetical protein [Polyangiaceae bacterium]